MSHNIEQKSIYYQNQSDQEVDPLRKLLGAFQLRINIANKPVVSGMSDGIALGMANKLILIRYSTGSVQEKYVIGLLTHVSRDSSGREYLVFKDNISTKKIENIFSYVEKTPEDQIAKQLDELHKPYTFPSNENGEGVIFRRNAY